MIQLILVIVIIAIALTGSRIYHYIEIAEINKDYYIVRFRSTLTIFAWYLLLIVNMVAAIWLMLSYIST